MYIFTSVHAHSFSHKSALSICPLAFCVYGQTHTQTPTDKKSSSIFHSDNEYSTEQRHKHTVNKCCPPRDSRTPPRCKQTTTFIWMCVWQLQVLMEVKSEVCLHLFLPLPTFATVPEQHHTAISPYWDEARWASLTSLDPNSSICWTIFACQPVPTSAVSRADVKNVRCFTTRLLFSSGIHL